MWHLEGRQAATRRAIRTSVPAGNIWNHLNKKKKRKKKDKLQGLSTVQDTIRKRNCLSCVPSIPFDDAGAGTETAYSEPFPTQKKMKVLPFELLKRKHVPGSSPPTPSAAKADDRVSRKRSRVLALLFLSFNKQSLASGRNKGLSA